MLSVLVVSPNPAVPGGVSTFIECMKRHVTRCRVDSFYVGSSGNGDASVWDMAKRLIVAPLKLAFLVRRKKYDVVHINPSFDVKSLIRDGLLVLALRATGFRHILFYYHGGNLALQHRIAQSPFWSRLVAWMLNRNALLLVLGENFRAALLAIGVDASRIVITRTMFEGSGLRAVKDEPSKAVRRFILFLSRFDREKGGRELLQAFAAVRNEFPDVDLIMAGDGEDMRPLRHIAQQLDLLNRTIFTGYIGGVEKWRLLRDCTLFALPTYFRGEGMPVAILEAMGAGKPLLVGAAGSIRTIVTEPENGLILEDVTVETVQKGLQRLLGDVQFIDRAGKHNADTAWKKFEANIVTAELEDIYQQVAKC